MQSRSLMPLLFFCFLQFCLACPVQATTAVPLEQKIGRLLLLGFRGQSLTENPQLEKDLRRGRLGGVVLFDTDVALHSDRRNIASPRQVHHLISELCAASALPLLVAVDQEGGKVARLKPKHGFAPTRSAMELGQQNDLALTAAATGQLAATLAEVGVNLNLAFVVLRTNPDNPVIAAYQRCFSDTPKQVVQQAGSYICAHRRQGVLTALKHFPGHGSSRDDSHQGFTDISTSWDQREMTTFRRLIDAGLVDSIMTAHVFNRQLDPHYPATLSPAIINGLLRQQLGYQGVVISDDLQMRAISDNYSFTEAIFQTLRAGVDILLFGNNLSYDPQLVQHIQSTIQKLVKSGEISETRIDRSYQRITNMLQSLETEKNRNCN